MTFVEEDLEEVAALRDGWDGEGSLAPSPETVANVRAFLRVVGAREPELTPNCNGTVSLEWDDESGHVHLEVGRTRFAMYMAGSGPTRFVDGEVR